MSAPQYLSAQLDALAQQAAHFADVAAQIADIVHKLATDPAVRNPGFGADQSGQAAAQKLLPPLTTGVQAASDMSGVLTTISDNVANWVEAVRQIEAASF